MKNPFEQPTAENAADTAELLPNDQRARDGEVLAMDHALDVAHKAEETRALLFITDESAKATALLGNVEAHGVSETMQDHDVPTLTNVVGSLEDIINFGDIDSVVSPETDKEFELDGEYREEFAKLSPEEKKDVGLKLNNLGFKFDRLLNDGLSRLGRAAGKQVDKEGTLGRFFAGYSKVYDDKNENLDERMKQINTGADKGLSYVMNRLTNVGYMSGNALKIGRPALGTVFAPLFGIGVVGTLVEAMKEARFENIDVKEKTRIQESDDAFDEAMAILQRTYEKTRIQDANVGYEEAHNVEDSSDQSSHLEMNKSFFQVDVKVLKKAYREEIPKDMLARLAESKELGARTNVVQKVFEWLITKDANKMQKEIEKIENDPSLSLEEQEQKKEGMLTRFGRSKRLQDYDRMLSQQGLVDWVAASGMFVGALGKGAMVGFMAQNAAMLFDNIADAITSSHKEGANINTHGAKKIPLRRMGEGATWVMGERDGTMDETTGPLTEAQMKALFAKVEPAPSKKIATVVALAQETVRAEKPPVLSMVKPGEGFSHVILRQVADQHPGWTKAELNKETQRLLVENNIIRSDGSEVRVSEAGSQVILKDGKISDGIKTYTYGETPKSIGSVEVVDRPAALPPRINRALGAQLLTENHPVVDGPVAPSTKDDGSQKNIEYATKREAHTNVRLSNGVNALFGSKGIFGFGAQNGADSISWKDKEVGFAHQTVDKVLSAKPSAFPEHGMRTFGIENDQETTKMKTYIEKLSVASQVKPNSGENLSDYIKRAEGKLFDNHQTQVHPEASAIKRIIAQTEKEHGDVFQDQEISGRMASPSTIVEHGEFGTSQVPEGILTSVEGDHVSEISTESGVKASFRYAKDGRIIKMDMTEGDSGFAKMNRALNTRWSGEMRLGVGEASFDSSLIRKNVLTLSMYRDVLKALEHSGQGSSQEASFLKKEMIKFNEDLNRKYGNISNPPTHVDPAVTQIKNDIAKINQIYRKK